MRIISGRARGTKLYTLEGLETRPTLDRVKESIFNIVAQDIPESYVLDLFSGSGAIGLEFASRGAKKVFLNDSSKDAIQIIKKNIEKTNLQDKVELSNCDFKYLLKNLKIDKFNIIYLDPPYKTSFVYEALKIIVNSKYIYEDTLIIIETDEPNRVLEEIQKLKIEIIDQRKYGRANIIFLKKR